MSDYTLENNTDEWRGNNRNGYESYILDSPPYDLDDYADATMFFEKNRIKQLQDERVHIQKKTFTKWCNSFLNRARMEIVDLFADMGDGVLLMKLLEIISGEKLGKPNRGRMRVQKIENLNRVLDFLKRKKIQLENIGAEDILDRNERLILGLIWTIILRFQIESIVIEDEEESGERKHAKDALLLWCQRKTAGYPHVKMDNFTSSWRSGLAFNALIHSHRPDLINYNNLNPNDHLGNLNNAFDVAEKKLDIARLLDAEDVNVNHPDEKSIITYVSMYYHYFARQKTELTGARRVAKILGEMMAQDRLQDDFEVLSSDLLTWIMDTIKLLNNHRFPNVLKGVQEEMIKFKSYRTQEKPPKYKEKGELEALFFTIQTKRKAMGRKVYAPPEGRLMQNIENAWNELDTAEHDRQNALAGELQRQERLEQLARKFDRKAKLRESWLREMLGILEEFDPGRTAAQVEAGIKKHEAISADILPREDRFTIMSVIANELWKEEYHGRDGIRTREKDIMDRWQQLLKALEARRQALQALNGLMTLFRDIDTLSAEFAHIEPLVRNRDVGKHILGVDDLLQKQNLIEAQINAHGYWLENIKKESQAYIRAKGEQYELLQRQADNLDRQYSLLVDLCNQRRVALDRARQLFQFIQDDEEEEGWLAEKTDVCNRLLQNRDLAATPQLVRLFTNLEMEMQSHWNRSKEVMSCGEQLLTVIVETDSVVREDVQRRVTGLQSRWEQLRHLAALVSRWLRQAQHAQHYFQDANEAESWIREKMPLVKSEDYGRDEKAAESLLSRHCRLEEEIQAYRSDICKLDEMAIELAQAEFLSDAVSSTEHITATQIEEVEVPQVIVIYPYSGNNVTVEKDEVLALIEKTNKDWWRILKQDGTEGFVPANYVRVTDDIVTVAQQIQVEKLETEVKKTSNLATGGQKKNPLLERQEAISSDYRVLTNLAQNRRRLLSDAIKLYRFYRECDEFDVWAKEAATLLNDESSAEHVQATRKKFDDLETDIAANGGTRLKRINEMAAELLGEGHSQSDGISKRRKAVNDLWNDLQTKKGRKRGELNTLHRVAAFEDMCRETRDWIRDKFGALDQNPDPGDLKSLQSLQRRHQNLERELKPVEAKMKRLTDLANQVKEDHPGQTGVIDGKLSRLNTMWLELKSRAETRRRLLEDTRGQQMFHGAVQQLLVWIEKIKSELNEKAKSVSVNTAEDLLKRHLDLKEELDVKDDEFGYVDGLGRRLLVKNPQARDVQDALTRLTTEQGNLRQMWTEKETAVNEDLELQLFNREADYIDGSIRGQRAFLSLTDRGDCLESVQNLQKRHGAFEAKFGAAGQRLAVFSRNAAGLVQNGHSHAAYIDQRCRRIVAARHNVQLEANKRRDELNAALEYEQLRREADEMSAWMGAKSGRVQEQGPGLAVRLQRHRAFQAELNANSEHLDLINSQGQDMIGREHYAKKEIGQILNKLNEQWKVLVKATAQRGDRLQQACDQKSLNLTLDDARNKLDEMEAALQSTDLGRDLRAVKDLVQKQNIIEQEMNIYDERVTEIVARGQTLASGGHFDARKILGTVQALRQRFDSLRQPAARRRAALEESRKWQQLAFDIDCELLWIGEKRPIASSANMGTSLTEATNLVKKHDQLESEINGHEQQIADALDKGSGLIDSDHYAKGDIRVKCDTLRHVWNELNGLSEARRKLLHLALKGEQYLFDATELENWMLEKRLLLGSGELGQDEDAALKLLTKHKTLQTDIDVYRKWLNELGEQAEAVNVAGHPESERLLKRQKELETDFEELTNVVEQRGKHLQDAVCLFNYLRESNEVEVWINEQLETATSEEYGTDYEHLTEVRNKFDEFQQSVKTGSDRFLLSETAANNLLRREPPFAQQILHRQEQLRSVWSLLLDYIESREEKLCEAEAVHRWNRDVAESLQQVMDKRAAISEELGRDVQQVHSLWLKHEAFENQLPVVEQHLQNVMEESGELKSSYPGVNAAHIAGQQTALAESWTQLQQAAVIRRDRLKASYDLQRFLANARDLIAWTEQAVAEMQSEQPVKDLQGAEWLLQEHSRLRAEINARQPEFAQLKQIAEKMLEKEHYARGEIGTRLARVESAVAKVDSEWQLREHWLLQLVQWHAFQREAGQTMAVLAAKDTTLGASKVGGSIDEVDSQMRKLDMFKRVFGNLEERAVHLDGNANTLIKQKHMEAANIDKLRRRVNAALYKLREHLNRKKLLLDEAMLRAKFHSDLIEMDNWIDEKLKRLRNEVESQGQLTSLEQKMKRLQKHQAFEAELAANESRVRQIKVQSNELQSKATGGDEIRKKSEKLLEKWELLAEASLGQSRALGEARDLLSFNQLVDRLTAWIRQKELMITASDMGIDFEHCQALLKKLNGSDDSDGTVDEQTIDSLNSLGEKLIKQGRSDKQYIRQQLTDVNQKWISLQGEVEVYRNQLLAVSKVHQFNRDVDDTNRRVLEKCALLSSDDYGKNLHAVQALLRKLNEIQRDMTAIREKLQSHDEDAQLILASKPPLESSIYESLRKLENSWDRLTQSAVKRGQGLERSHSLHKYLDALKKSEAWASNIRSKMTSYQAPCSVDEAKALIEAHKEKLAEIDGRQEYMSQLNDWGQKLIQEQPEHKAELSRAHKRMQSLEHQTRQTWELHNQQLYRAYDLQLFNDQVMLAESWLAGKEAFLKQEDVGDSLDSVDILLKKHDDFEKTLIAQSDKIEHLQKDAQTLTEKNGENRDEIQLKKQEILDRHKTLLTACERRRNVLLQSRKLYTFLKSCIDLINWITAKLQLAYDESFLDPTNLRSKLQKHQAFDAEIEANRSRLDTVIGEGNRLIQGEHFASEQVKLQLIELTNGWEELTKKSALKTDKLKEAHDALLFTQKLDDMDKWLDGVENDLACEDHGKNWQSVDKLIKKHDLLRVEIEAHENDVAELSAKAVQLTRGGHFMAGELTERSEKTNERYRSLGEPCQIRMDNLKEAQLLYQWIREAEEESEWIGEKMPAASSVDYGDSFQAVQALHKRHAALVAEIDAKQSVIEAVEKKGNRMTANGHFASVQIQEIVDDLTSMMLSLKEQVAKRSQKLKEALNSQQYYMEAVQAEQWIRDRIPLVQNEDVGRDQDAADAHLRKLAVIEKEAVAFNGEIERLQKIVNTMVSEGHFDVSQLTSRQTRLELGYKDLCNQLTKRRTRLVDAGKYYNFLRLSDDLIQWLNEKERLAASEDYGRDLDECQQLIDQFEQVVRQLTSAGERVASVQRNREELLRSGHPYAASIKAKGSDLHQLWSDVNQAATDRQQALLGAKQVHRFDQEADETLNWLQEKEATQVVMEQEDLSQADLVAINNLMLKHGEFERGMTAVEKQVNELNEEAERLETRYPDTRDHLEVRRQEMSEQLKDVNRAADKHGQRLVQAQQLQAYFQEYRDLMTWVKEMQMRVTSETLPRDVTACDMLTHRHLEYSAEINARQPQIEQFVRVGTVMVRQQHILSCEIQKKVDSLVAAEKVLREVWTDRKTLYEQNEDVQLWRREASGLETWMLQREDMLADQWRHADSIDAVEDMIREYDDFLTTLQAQEDKFEGLKRSTLLEQAFSNLLQKEADRFRREESMRDKLKKEQIRTVGKQKILEERRQERERRKTQEISLLKPSQSAPDQQATAAALHRRTSEPRLLIRTSSRGKRSDGRSTPASTATPTKLSTAENRLEIGSEGDEQRKESAKRTPSFTTRRAQSLKRVRQWDDLASIDMHGYLERKQELQSGGKKATIRCWKQYETILCGQLLCFFKDEQAFMENMAAAPPLYILRAVCRPHFNYLKRPCVFKLTTQDGAEYLFAASSEQQMNEWVAKISFHANLEPSNQLRSFEQARNDNETDTIPRVTNSKSAGSRMESENGLTRRHTVQAADRGAPVSSVTSNDDSGLYSPKDLNSPFIESSPLKASSNSRDRRSSSTAMPETNGYDSPGQAITITGGEMREGRQSIDSNISSSSCRSLKTDGKRGSKQQQTVSADEEDIESSCSSQVQDDADNKKKSKGFGSLFKRSSKHKDSK